MTSELKVRTGLTLEVDGSNLIAVASGDIERSELSEYFKQHDRLLEQIKSDHGRAGKIIDLRRVTARRLSPRQLVKVHRLNKRAVQEGLKAIGFIVTDKTAPTLLAQMKQYRAFHLSTPIGFFSTLDEAKAWSDRAAQ